VNGGPSAVSIDTVVILLLVSVPVALSCVLVVLAVWTNRTVAAIKAAQDRKSAEMAMNELAEQNEAARAEMEDRLTREIERRQP